MKEERRKNVEKKRGEIRRGQGGSAVMDRLQIFLHPPAVGIKAPGKREGKVAAAFSALNFASAEGGISKGGRGRPISLSLLGGGNRCSGGLTHDPFLISNAKKENFEKGEKTLSISVDRTKGGKENEPKGRKKRGGASTPVPHPLTFCRRGVPG